MDNKDKTEKFQNEPIELIDNLKRTKKVKIDKNYNYIPKNILFKLTSFLLYLLAYPVIYIYDKIIFGLKIKGRKNLKNIKGSKITVSNHINLLDATFVSLANFPIPLYFPTIKSNLEIPFISILVKLFKGLPIPTTLEGKRLFYSVIIDLLSNGKSIHFYPEAHLLPYHEKIRSFKDGAFDFACSCNVPIVPIVYTYRKPKGIMKYIKKTKYITVNILPAIYPTRNGNKEVKGLKDIVHETMENFFNENNEF